MKTLTPAGSWEWAECICRGLRVSRQLTADISGAGLAMELPWAFSVAQRPILRPGITTLAGISLAPFSMPKAAILMASTIPALPVWARLLKTFRTPRSRQRVRPLRPTQITVRLPLSKILYPTSEPSQFSMHYRRIGPAEILRRPLRELELAAVF